MTSFTDQLDALYRTMALNYDDQVTIFRKADGSHGYRVRSGTKTPPSTQLPYCGHRLHRSRKLFRDEDSVVVWCSICSEEYHQCSKCELWFPEYDPKSEDRAKCLDGPDEDGVMSHVSGKPAVNSICIFCDMPGLTGAAPEEATSHATRGIRLHTDPVKEGPKLAFCFSGHVTGAEIKTATNVEGETVDVSQMRADDLAGKLNRHELTISLEDYLYNNRRCEIVLDEFDRD